MQTIKAQLIDFCRLNLASQEAEIQQRLDALSESRNQETKSTAGDKYETGRAMVQIEEDKARRQMLQNQELTQALDRVPWQKAYEQGQSGALIITDRACFFVSVSMGKVKLGEQEYFCISPLAPLAKQFFQKQAGDLVQMNQTSYKILEVA